MQGRARHVGKSTARLGGILAEGGFLTRTRSLDGYMDSHMVLFEQGQGLPTGSWRMCLSLDLPSG